MEKMLTAAEWEYASALAALGRRDYINCLAHFDAAGTEFERDAEFVLLRETVRTLLEVKRLRSGEASDRLIGYR